MPDSRPLPSIGNGVNELRLTDLNTEWRIIYRIDPDALIAVDVFLKKTQKTPQRVIVLCIKRLQNDDAFNSKP